MAEKERLGKAVAKTLRIGKTQTYPVVAGQVTITGSGTVTVPLQSITGVTVSLGAAPVTGAASASVTVSANVITISVWTSTFGASSAATVVNWVAVGT